MAKKKKLEDVCFPIPKNFSLAIPQKIDANEKVKKHIFQQTLQAAHKLKIPYEFKSSYNPEEPYQLASKEEIEEIISLFQAIQPKDAIELALAQQFIIVHIQAIKSAIGGLNDIGLKKIELTHHILESLNKYRTKGAQLINVQYNHNQGQINNIKVVEKDNPIIEVN